MTYETKDLSEEGVGFGAPVLKNGYETVYPGSISLETARAGLNWIIRAHFDLNIRERVYVHGKPIRNKAFYRLNEGLSGLHRRLRPLREIQKKSSLAIRRALGTETRFEAGASSGRVRAEYTITPEKGTVALALDLSEIRRSQRSIMYVMNELGANFFSRYRDSDGLILREGAIGTWDETKAEEASFEDPGHGLAFTLPKVRPARMYRGRELLPGRLAWAGIAYRLPGQMTSFHYSLKLHRTMA